MNVHNQMIDLIKARKPGHSLQRPFYGASSIGGRIRVPFY